MFLNTVNSFPPTGVVQTEAQLAMGRAQRLLSGAAGFSMRRVVVTSADGLGRSASLLAEG